jgi:TIR domain-containing protein
MNHVFISHSHEDGDFAEILNSKLTQAGFTVWTDAKIRGGVDWRKEIDQAIKNASALIVVVTEEARTSEYVTYEWAFAWGAGVKVIPVLRKLTKLHPRLESLQYLDFTDQPSRPWDTLVALLREAESSKPEDEIPIKRDKVDIENKNERAAYQRMIKALRDENWIWRSIEKLAAIGGVSEKEAVDILRQDTNVAFGKGKSGRRIAKLVTKSRG